MLILKNSIEMHIIWWNEEHKRWWLGCTWATGNENEGIQICHFQLPAWIVYLRLAIIGGWVLSNC